MVSDHPTYGILERNLFLKVSEYSIHQGTVTG